MKINLVRNTCKDMFFKFNHYMTLIFFPLMNRHIYFFDADEEQNETGETRRVVGIEWKSRNNGMSGQHVCITQLIYDSELDESDDETYESYYINEELHRMIIIAPFPYNQRVNLIKE